MQRQLVRREDMLKRIWLQKQWFMFCCYGNHSQLACCLGNKGSSELVSAVCSQKVCSDF